MHITKMHGLGNDYLFVYGAVPEGIAELSRKLSDRHFGIGSDGMIFIQKAEKADFQMRIFNADGSEAKMCGNGIRCVGKYVYDRGYTKKTKLQIDTLSGIKTVKLLLCGERAVAAAVGMGKTVVEAERQLEVLDRIFTVIPVSVGNEHAVLFTDNVEQTEAERLGPLIERHPAYPDGVNVEFIQKIGADALRMRVWERGSGITLACGTGACASVAAAVSKGLFPIGSRVTVVLEGGNLQVRINPDGTADMTGPAETVFDTDVEV